MRHHSKSRADLDRGSYVPERVANVCSRCGVRYEFELPRVIGIGSSMAAGFYRRRAAEGVCPCCYRPGNRAAKSLARLRITRRWARKLNDLSALLVLAGLAEEATNADIKNEARRVSRRLEQYPVEELRALATEINANSGTTCCPMHARNEVLRAMVAAGASRPGLLPSA